MVIMILEPLIVFPFGYQQHQKVLFMKFSLFLEKRVTTTQNRRGIYKDSTIKRINLLFIQAFFFKLIEILQLIFNLFPSFGSQHYPQTLLSFSLFLFSGSLFLSPDLSLWCVCYEVSGSCLYMPLFLTLTPIFIDADPWSKSPK